MRFKSVSKQATGIACTAPPLIPTLPGKIKMPFLRKLSVLFASILSAKAFEAVGQGECLDHDGQRYQAFDGLVAVESDCEAYCGTAPWSTGCRGFSVGRSGSSLWCQLWFDAGQRPAQKPGNLGDFVTYYNQKSGTGEIASSDGAKRSYATCYKPPAPTPAPTPSRRHQHQRPHPSRLHQHQRRLQSQHHQIVLVALWRLA